MQWPEDQLFVIPKMPIELELPLWARHPHGRFGFGDMKVHRYDWIEKGQEVASYVVHKPFFGKPTKARILSPVSGWLVYVQHDGFQDGHHPPDDKRNHFLVIDLLPGDPAPDTLESAFAGMCSGVWENRKEIFGDRSLQERLSDDGISRVLTSLRQMRPAQFPKSDDYYRDDLKESMRARRPPGRS